MFYARQCRHSCKSRRLLHAHKYNGMCWYCIVRKMRPLIYHKFVWALISTKPLTISLTAAAFVLTPQIGLFFWQNAISFSFVLACANNNRSYPSWHKAFLRLHTMKHNLVPLCIETHNKVALKGPKSKLFLSIFFFLLQNR